MRPHDGADGSGATQGGYVKRTLAAATVALFAIGAPAANAQIGVDRLYVIECGERTVADISPWTPGVNVGKPGEFVDTCYLLKHANDWMLWDTGVTDTLFAVPSNEPNAWKRKNTLQDELARLGVKPSDVKYVAISHSHPDHIGNVELFPRATLLVQKLEYEWPNQDGSPRFQPAHPVKKIEGDYDIFGDGSATLLATPGHTPGHQSLLVKLPKTGAVLLSGDAVHLKENWEAKRVPSINFDKDKSQASMQRMAEIMTKYNAELWINHDKGQAALMKRPPAYYE
jgi:glyoxylase-like metal-dependent hydrolase (beta-lactamase superfamily II)